MPEEVIIAAKFCVLDSIGAAAACAKLLKLEKEEILNALGMAGTQSSGLWAFLGDGASSKKLHPARAAVNGLTAVFMAKAKMTGPEHILDAKDGGLYRATSDFYNLEAVSKDLGKKYELMHSDIKPYPCCRSTHCAIDAVLNIKRNTGISEENIEGILIETYEVGFKQCGSANYPKKSVEAKFSTPYTVAVALVDGEVMLEQFTPGKIADLKIKDLVQKVVVKPSEKYTEKYPAQWGCLVTIKMFDGQVIKEEVSDASGSIKNPLSSEQAKDKFILLTAPILGKEPAIALMNSIFEIDKLAEIPFL